MEKIFVAMSSGGISNRIKTLVSCQRLAKKYCGKVLLYWPKTKTCFAFFHDLFQNDIELISTEELKQIIESGNYRYHNDNKNIYYDNKKKYQIFSGWRLIFDESEKDQIKNMQTDLSFEKLNTIMNKEFEYFFTKLSPSKDVKNNVSGFKNKHKTYPFLGVHIRRGDFLESKDNIASVSPVDSFIKKIGSFLKDNPEKNVFLCTDSCEVESKLKNRFKGKIITYKKTSFDKFDTNFVKEGLVDMLLLSKTKKIFATYHSTFSEGAWWLSGCKNSISTVIDEEKLSQYIKNKKSFFKSIIPNSKKFIFELFVPLKKRIIR